MLIFAPKESDANEPRTAVTPDSTGKLVALGAEVAVEAGVGARASFVDKAYRAAGAQVRDDRTAALGEADVVVRVRQPPVAEVAALKADSVHLSFLDPFNESALVDALAAQRISAISMELVPRSTKAQKLDALSSQHNLAGYAMVIMAANRLQTIFPLMTTPSGTIQPARVFIIGAGVAGLQAIATAKRLGARVEAFDTRPVVAEQVESLGARFVQVDLGETGQTEQGYAKELTPEQLQKQQAVMADRCAQADVVITTAQLFGRKAPLVVTKEIVERMKNGSVVIDYAVESGGNVEGSVPGEDVVVGGVTIIGYRNIPGRVAASASQMYANNVYSYIEQFWDKERKVFTLDREDEIVSGSLVTHDGQMINEMVKSVTGS